MMRKGNEMSRKYCINCGEPEYSGRCTNCHEELFILDQYYELGMDLPNEDTEFMQKVKRLQQEVDGCNYHRERNKNE